MSQLTFEQINSTILDTLKKPNALYWKIVGPIPGRAHVFWNLGISNIQGFGTGWHEYADSLGDVPDQLRVLGRDRALGDPDFRHFIPVTL